MNTISVPRTRTTAELRDRLREIMDASSAEPIIKAVCKMFSISRERLLGRSRDPYVVWPRHIAMSLVRRFTRSTLPEIGAVFDRHHTAVLYACGRMQPLFNRLPLDADLHYCVKKFHRHFLSFAKGQDDARALFASARQGKHFGRGASDLSPPERHDHRDPKTKRFRRRVLSLGRADVRRAGRGADARGQ